LSSPRKTAGVSIRGERHDDDQGLTVLGLQIPVQDHGLPRITGRLRVGAQSHDIAAGGGRVFAKVAAVQGADDLAEDAPHKLLLAHLVLVLQVADDAAQVAVPAVLHVQVQILRDLDVVALEVGDDVRVAELLEDGELGLELFALLLRHLLVADFLAAEDL
jgi:hypothetical protein